MLTCKEQVALSSDFIDDELGTLKRWQMRQHLLFCPACRRFIRQLRWVGKTVQALPEQPRDDLEQLAQRLMKEHTAPSE
ncbi:MAG TPA: zf-HC2 domain-containing protein [Pseudomonas sp.]|jgi:predicted anti-sigma-YlaC factor YlaD